MFYKTLIIDKRDVCNFILKKAPVTDNGFGINFKKTSEG